jgi:polyphenol oxidase
LNTSPASHTSQKPPQTLLPVEILRVPQWADRQWLLHGFSTRAGGPGQSGEASQEIDGLQRGELNLGYLPNIDPAIVASNRRQFLRGVLRSRPGDQEVCGLVTLKQMHSSLVRRVGRSEMGGPASLWGDGLVTDEPGVLVGIQTADCLPVLIADRKRRVVGAFHAGWRGTLKGIIQEGVAEMRREFGSDPEDLTAAIGPGIGSCCFAVGAEVQRLFASRYAYAGEIFHADSNRLLLDLVEANRRQLIAAGVRPDAVFSLGECTNCHPERFFSYRAEKGRTGRMMAVIGVETGPSRR